MSKDLEVVLAYDASVERVGKMLASKDFREEVCAAQDCLSHQVSVAPDGAGHRMTVTQEHDVQGVPGFVAKLVGDRISLVQSETWRTPADGAIDVSVPGKPVSVRGTAVVTPDGAGSVETVRLTIKVSVPVVGGKVEGLLHDLFAAAMRREHEVGVRWVTEGRA